MFSPHLLPQSFLKRLIKHEKLDYLDKESNTLAHLCALYNHMEHLSALEKDLSKKNKYGHTPYDIAHLLGRERKNSCCKSRLKIFRTKEKIFDHFNQEQIETHFGFKYLDHLLYKSPRFLKWTTRKSHKVLQDQALKWKNHWTLCMYERDFQNKKIPDVYVKWVDPIVGYGLFSGCDIPQYSYLGEYTGIVKKRQSRKDLENDYIFGYVTGPFETPFVIDAQNRGNFTRFINHSDTPNLFSTWMISGGICHIILFASRFISKDTQLTYDYGPYYWKKRTSPLNL